MCVHDTDNRGFCVKNGPHCAFAHGLSDLRQPVYDIRELQAIEKGEADSVAGPNSLDKERSLLNDDPKWLETTYVLANYKTEPCKKPPRLCRQGYACPQFHNNKDKRRSPKKFKYRSTPCPNVKSGDEWGDPAACDSGDNCQYCHTRTEQQFHPEIYKSTKCNDIQNTSYCPRGAFCAFAHVDQETVSLDSPPPESNASFGDLLSQVMPGGGSDESREIEVNNGMPLQQRAPGSQLRNGSITPPFEENGIASPIDKPKNSPIANSLGSSIDSALMSNLSNQAYPSKNRFLSGDQVATGRDTMIRRQLFSIENDPNLSHVEKVHRKASLMMDSGVMSNNNNNVNVNTFSNNGSSLFPSFVNDPLESVGSYLDDLNLDPFDCSKSRKSSGFSEGTNKSRQYSGYDVNNKSRNCSGNSISAGFVCSGLLNGSAPVMIPGSRNLSPQGHSPLSQSGANGYGSMNQPNEMENTLMNANHLGLFDLTGKVPTSAATAAATSAAVTSRDAEILRLKDELVTAHARLSSWEESIQQARTACEAWKKETALATKKMEQAIKEKENATAKASQLQKELDGLNGGPHLHAIARVSDLKGQPTAILKTIEWQLRKDLQEVEKIMRSQVENNQWFNSSRLFDFPPSSSNDWSLGLVPTQHPIYGSLAQQ